MTFVLKRGNHKKRESQLTGSLDPSQRGQGMSAVDSKKESTKLARIESGRCDIVGAGWNVPHPKIGESIPIAARVLLGECINRSLVDQCHRCQFKSDGEPFRAPELDHQIVVLIPGASLEIELIDWIQSECVSIVRTTTSGLFCPATSLVHLLEPVDVRNLLQHEVCRGICSETVEDCRGLFVLRHYESVSLDWIVF